MAGMTLISQMCSYSLMPCQQHQDHHHCHHPRGVCQGHHPREIRQCHHPRGVRQCHHPQRIRQAHPRRSRQVAWVVEDILHGLGGVLSAWLPCLGRVTAHSHLLRILSRPASVDGEYIIPRNMLLHHPLQRLLSLGSC